MRLKEYVNTPHLAFPLDLSAGSAAVTEQDSLDEIVDCVEVILLTPRGTRDDQPDFGLADPTFRMNGVDLSEIEGTVSQWEPRADVEAIRQAIQDGEDRIQVNVGGNG